MLGLYAGRGRESEDDDPTLFFMVEDLVKWFDGRATARRTEASAAATSWPVTRTRR